MRDKEEGGREEKGREKERKERRREGGRENPKGALPAKRPEVLVRNERQPWRINTRRRRRSCHLVRSCAVKHLIILHNCTSDLPRPVCGQRGGRARGQGGSGVRAVTPTCS